MADRVESNPPAVPHSRSRRRVRRDDLAVDELVVTVRVSYKTLAMIFALFSVASRIVNVFVDWL